MTREISTGPFPDLVAHLKFQKDTLGELAERYNLDPSAVTLLLQFLDTRITQLQNLPPGTDTTQVMEDFWRESAEFERRVTEPNNK